MALEHYIVKGSKKLRCGYTTGSCAAIASKAAAKMALTKELIYEETIITPKKIAVTTEVNNAEIFENSAKCSVKKDGGDDIDATDGMDIYSVVTLTEEKGVFIDGGKGIGRVTKDGLNQPKGNAAINNVPRQMIREELESVAIEYGYKGGFKVIIEAPEGEDIAQRTFNPNLGIVGGISIIGTTGIVEPQSIQALIDTIEVEMKMYSSNGAKDIILTPGNYGESFIENSEYLKYKNTVKISNFVGEALDFSYQYGFENVLLVMHIGKGIKVAGGVMNTHSKYADCRKEIFTAYAALAGADIDVIKKLMESATTDAAIDILKNTDIYEEVIKNIINSAENYAVKRSGVKCGIVFFSNVHGLIGISKNGKEIIDKWSMEE